MILLKIAFGLFFLSCACWLAAKVTAPTLREPWEYPSTFHIIAALVFVALLLIALVTGAVGMFLL